MTDVVSHGASWQALVAYQLTRLLSLGPDAVGVFIVLSGFCLMLPVVRAGDWSLRGGVTGFFKGRIRRIIPPYYAAIAVSIALLMITAAIQNHAVPSWPVSRWDVVSHLLLIHNLAPSTINSINAAMWSIATEFQIYLLFPLLLLVASRAGLTASVLCGFGLGYAVMVSGIATEHYGLLLLAPWYLGLFTLGMAGAVICHSPEPRFARLRDKAPWGLITLGWWIVFALCRGLVGDPETRLSPRFWRDPILGLATSSLIVYLANYPVSLRKPLILRFLESRAMSGLGVFSYSLYLIHLPLIGLFDLAIPGRLDLSPLLVLLLSLGLSLLCIPASYLFFLAFERPLLKSNPISDQTFEMKKAQLTGGAWRVESHTLR
jgi:peptidoglycan/LPS O-acetylase OafA/YrhL